MATASRSALIQRPQADMSAYLADPSRHNEWNLALLRTDMLDTGPVAVGTRAVEVRRMFGHEVRSPFTITLHDPPDRQDFHTTGGPIRPDGIMRCTNERRACRVSYEMTLRGPLAPILIRGLSRGMEGNLANVKRVIEARS